MFEEARVIAGTSASGIDQRRAAASRQNERIDAERCSAPIDMRVQIDQAGRHDLARHIKDAAGAVGEVRAGRDDLAVGKSHIHDAVDGLRRIDDAPTAQNEIIAHRQTTS